MIYLKDIVQNAESHAGGRQLCAILDEYIQKGEQISVSLENVDRLSNSFLRSSIGELSNRHGYEKFKKHVRFVQIQRPLSRTIREYLAASNLSMWN